MKAKWAVLAAAVMLSGPTLAQANIHFCEINGRKTFQDRPCPAGTQGTRDFSLQLHTNTSAGTASAEQLQHAALAPSLGASVSPLSGDLVRSVEALVDQIRLLEAERQRQQEAHETDRVNTLAVRELDDDLALQIERLDANRLREMSRIEAQIESARAELAAMLAARGRQDP